jgi:hypothetical protein
MVPDQFYDLLNDGGYWRFDGWRCLCCGNILDPVIIRNQQAMMMKGTGNAFLAGEDHEATLGQDSEILVSSAT